MRTRAVDLEVLTKSQKSKEKTLNAGLSTLNFRLQDTSYAMRSAETGSMLFDPIRGHSAPVMSAQFHPEGRLIATASQDKLVKVDHESLHPKPQTPNPKP